MSKKRGNNEGSIYQRADGRWAGQVLFGTNLEGKPSRKYIYGETRKGVADKEAKALTDIQNDKVFYNRKRRRQALGYLSSADFKQRYLGQKAA